MVAIVDYQAGNITSVKNALSSLGHSSIITSDKSTIKNADKVIFPGVGEASSAMKFLRQKNLDQVIMSLKQPVLGICLGQQLMCQHSEEGDTECLGIFEVGVRRFPEKGIIPHMGWNNIAHKGTCMFQHVPDGADVYFVHSYYCDLSHHTTATCEYLVSFSAAMQKDNFYATQFHPEKSGETGMVILSHFLKSCQ